jgi:putative spermidine/putrescine transport system permease protein
MIPTGKAYVALCIWTIAVSIFVLAPLVVTMAVSLTATEYISLPWKGVSLRWYEDFFGRPDFLSAFRNSLLLAAQATFISILLGTPVAIAMTRYRFPGRGLVMVFTTSPLFIPLVMSGLAILIFFSTFNIGGPATRLFVAHVAITVPYIIRMVSTSMAGFDWNQEVAARNLGASPLRAFIEIILPQVLPGVIAGGLFALIVSFDDVGISIFLIGASYTTLPVELYAFAAYDMTPMVTAASVIMITLSAISVMLIEWFFGVQRMLSGGVRGDQPQRPQAAAN